MKSYSNQYHRENMFVTRFRIYITAPLAFLLLINYTVFTTAKSSRVDNIFHILKENREAFGRVEKLAFGYDVVTVMILVLCVSNIVVYKIRELQEAKSGAEDKSVLLSSWQIICRRFSLAEIQRATHNFDDKCLVAKGGSGKVYKDFIDDGLTCVAIKRLCFLSKKDGRAAFWTEIEMLSKFRHSHLVSLIGYCDEWDEMIIVFDYIPNGTLTDHLHRKRYSLSWVQRLRICIGAARGLEYLHTGASICERVIHRDVKSANILLDDNMEAKTADFGISKTVASNHGCTYVSTLVRGTFGYMDPAYFSTGRLTKKSDAYSFGVVLFEVLCGRRAVDLSRDDLQSGLAGWARECVKEGRVNEIIDSTLKMQISQNSLLAFVKIASQCLNSQPKCRPTMAELVVVLEFALSLQESANPTRVERVISSNNTYSTTAMEVVYAVDQIKPFQTNCTRITFTTHKEGCPYSFSSDSGVICNAKQSSYSRNRKGRVHNTGIIPEANNRTRLNNIGIVPEAKGRIGSVNSRIFTLAELLSTTRGFNPDMMVGRGSYGMAFIGWVDEETFSPSRIGIGMAVAVKRFNPDGYKVFRSIQKEVDICGRFHHPNLVRLFGFCSEGEEFLLVYEFTAKVNLEQYLYRDNGKPLSLDVWLKILIGAAHYLDFLHSSENPIIFCDFKPSVIQLDGDFNAKIVDRGRARYGAADGDALVTATPCASAEQCSEHEGYISPEYKKTGDLSTKTDVYAFGVLLLEILTGMRVTDVNRRNKKNLVDKARPVLSCERKVKKVLNPNLLQHKCCPEGVHAFLSAVPELALKCIDLKPEKRPAMIQVLKTLEEVNSIIK